MAGQQERKRREVMITKALLLGYTIEWDPEDGGFFLKWPDGRRYIQRAGPTSTWVHWPAPWLAAQKALRLSGVPDAKDVPRDTGVGSGKSYRLRGRRILRGSFKSLFKKFGAS